MPREAIEYQQRALAQVSRTFALTIPTLPAPIRDVIGNAYLLCRIADTIEDEPRLSPSSKREYLQAFADVLSHPSRAKDFAHALGAELTDGTPQAERDLVLNSELVIDFQRCLPKGQARPIHRCIKSMCKGMAEFVETGREGVANLAELERYCYYVAGVVGEMITDVLCDYSDEIALRREKLFALAARFGHGLQMVNILKDQHEDRQRGVNWLPQFPLHDDGHFAEMNGHSLAGHRTVELIAVAEQHLSAALQYLLLIPNHETGIRRFLAWSLGFAALTLRRIHANPSFNPEESVKISRREVYVTIASTNVAIRSNRALRWLFNRATSYSTRVKV